MKDTQPGKTSSKASLAECAFCGFYFCSAFLPPIEPPGTYDCVVLLSGILITVAALIRFHCLRRYWFLIPLNLVYLIWLLAMVRIPVLSDIYGVRSF